MHALSQPMKPAELKRLAYRQGLFVRRGLWPEPAHELALRLLERDAEKDDRRVCLECRHFQRSRTCARQQSPLPMQLQRCPKFDWQTPA